MPVHSLSGAYVDLGSSGELPLSRAVNAILEHHAAGEFTQGNALPEGIPFGESQTPKNRGSAPASGE
jgi:hypothetical protein